jgi:hypothetical protein
MWRVYKAEPYLDTLVGAIRGTLADHCEKDVLIERSIKQAVFRFTVPKPARRNSPVKAEGILGKCNFIFRSGGKGTFFSANRYDDPENTFFQFAIMMDFFRKDLGLAPLDFGGLHEIAEADSPPVGADNYALFDAADIGPLQTLLDKNFPGRAHREISGKYSVTVYSDNARASKYFPENNIPVCQKFLGAFQDTCGYKDAMLVCARKGKEQHSYFHVKGTGTFYNTLDSSRAFLEQEQGVLKAILSTVKQLAGRRKQLA